VYSRVPSNWHLPFTDRGGMQLALLRPLAFNHIRGRGPWLVECFPLSVERRTLVREIP
jgi:hypothetical protein